jgi:hypothetical protein
MRTQRKNAGVDFNGGICTGITAGLMGTMRLST